MVGASNILGKERGLEQITHWGKRKGWNNEHPREREMVGTSNILGKERWLEQITS